MPRQMATAIATEILAKESDRTFGRQMAALTMLTFCLYQKPGIAARLKWKNLIMPQDCAQYYGIDIALHQGPMFIDHPRFQWLGPVLLTLKCERARENDFIFGRHAARKFSSTFMDAARRLGFAELGICSPMQLRHGGASAEAHEEFRPLKEIQARLKVSNFRTAKKYKNEVRWAALFERMSESQRKMTDYSDAQIQNGFSRR